MESPLQCGNLLNENLQKIDNILQVGESLKGLNFSESEKVEVKMNENKENVSDVNAEEEIIGEQAINSIHLPYRHIAMNTGKNIRSKLLRVGTVWRIGLIESSDLNVLFFVLFCLTTKHNN